MVHTGQHFDPEMSDIFFAELGIPQPRVNLGINGGSHGAMTGRMLIALEELIAAERPTAVMVYGDTNSTLAGALAAAKLRVPVVHIEAGLRSFNRGMPEEINRLVTDHISALLFCPTRAAIENLEQEGIKDGVYAVGDVMYDASVHAVVAARAASTILARLGLEDRGYSLVTLHRAENTDDPRALAEILSYLRERGQERPVVFPVHPRTRVALARHGLSTDGLRLLAPLGFLDMQRLLSGAAMIFTDSGGLQKEAYFHRIPCVTLRNETEWVETIGAGWNRLWRGPDYRQRREIADYGDGHAAERILACLLEHFGKAPA
jgi:UDP-GlcNAc3NAcA epimerase